MHELWKNIHINGYQISIQTIQTKIVEMTNILQNIYNYSKKPTSLAIEDILYYYINIYLIDIEINQLKVEKLIAYAQQHLSFSQYFGQIRRCTDLKCCAPQPAEITSSVVVWVGININSRL